MEQDRSTLLHQQKIYQTEPLRRQDAQQFQLLTQQQAFGSGATLTHRPETLKIDISKGGEEKSL